MTDYPGYLSGRPRSRAVTLQLAALMSDQDLRSDMRPAFHSSEPSEALLQAEPPTPYLQQLRNMLDDQSQADSPSVRPTVLLNQGAES